MAHQFPDITTYGAALRFALEAEQACADLAAAAGVLAPDQTWRDKLEEIVCTHDDRVAKLTATRQETEASAGVARRSTPARVPRHAGRGARGPLAGSRRTARRAPRRTRPATTRPSPPAAARMLGARAKAFEKSAAQDRAAAAQLRDMLG